MILPIVAYGDPVLRKKSVDIDRDNGVLYVHWIDVKEKDIESATRIIVARFEKILKKIFD